MTSKRSASTKRKQSENGKQSKPRTPRAITPIHFSEEPREAWHRRLDESTKAYQAFCYYYALPPHLRSIDAAYKVFWEEKQQKEKQQKEKQHEKSRAEPLQSQDVKRSGGKKTYSKSTANVQQKTPPTAREKSPPKPPKRASRRWFHWSAEFDWVQRAVKFDQHQAEQRAKRNFEKAFKRLEKQQLDVEMAQQLGAKWLLDLLADKRFTTLSYEKQVALALGFMRLLPSLQEAERHVLSVLQSVLNQDAKVLFSSE